MRLPHHLWLLLSAGCGGLGSVPGDFASVAREAPQDQPVLMTVRNGYITILAAPLGVGGVPAAIRRVAESVHPDGETVVSLREWGPLGSGYRVQKHYPEEDSGRWRSVLVDTEGSVLERTHSLPIAVVPQAVLAAAGRDSRGHLERVEVVQNIRGEEFFRIRARNTLDQEYLVECSVEGTDLQVSRILQAQLTLD